jgi:hypothetical protein
VVKGERPFYAARLAHNHLLQPFRTLAGEVPDGDLDAAKAQVTRAAELIAEADATRSVVSAELFYQLDPVSLRKIIDDHFAALADDVRIVAYVRPHHDWITSTFAESLKIGTFFGDLGRFYEAEGRNSNALPYHARFSRWRATFGDRFVLRPFVREALAGKSVVSDFARFALGPGRFSVSGSPPSNESLALEDLVRLAMLQDRMDAKRGWLFQHHVGWEFHRIVGLLDRQRRGRPFKGTRVRMHRSLAVEIRDRFRTDAKKMDRDFFAEKPVLQAALDTAVEKACESVQSVDPRDHFTASEIRSIELFREMIGAMMDKQGGTWVRFLENKRVNTRDAIAKVESV